MTSRPTSTRMTQHLTFFDKVWDDHVIAELGDDADLLQIDRLVLHELSRQPGGDARSRRRAASR